MRVANLLIFSHDQQFATHSYEQRFQSHRISFASISSVFRSSFVENNRHLIVNRFNQSIPSSHATVAIFTAQTWRRPYRRPLAVSLRSESSTKF